MLPTASPWLAVRWVGYFGAGDDLPAFVAALRRWHSTWGAELVAAWGTMLQFTVARRPQHGEARQVLCGHGDEIERDADADHGGNIEARHHEFEAGERQPTCRPGRHAAGEADRDACRQRRDDTEKRIDEPRDEENKQQRQDEGAIAVHPDQRVSNHLSSARAVAASSSLTKTSGTVRATRKSCRFDGLKNFSRSIVSKSASSGS